MESEKSESHLVVSNSLRAHWLYSPWNSPGQNSGVGSLSLLQGIFLTQGSNPGLLHCRQILYQLSHKGSPRILEWVPYPFSRRSSWPRSWTRVSCIVNWFHIGKGVHQGCILSPCLFNLYAEYIMWNARLDKAQTGIKIPGSNNNNIKYADRKGKWSQPDVSNSLRPHGL